MACIACGSSDQRAFVAREMMFGTREPFSYLECRGCGSLQIAAVPADLPRHYPDNYYSYASAAARPGRVKRAVLYPVFRSLLRGPLRRLGGAIAARRPHSLLALALRLGLRASDEVLDVGSGSGALVDQLAWLGLPAPRGADPYVAAPIVHASGARVEKVDIRDVVGTFDVIMFHHSLEHVADPGDVLRGAAARLKPGGRCIVRIPTSSSRAFRDYGTDWVQLDPPRHLFIPSREGMRLLGEANGLRLASSEDDSTPFQFFGSEQYRRDLPLFHDGSLTMREGVFTEAQLTEWERLTAEVNARGEGDQSIFRFERQAS